MSRPSSPIDWIAVGLLPGFGPASLQQALERYGDPAEIAYRLPPRAFLSLRGFSHDAVEPLIEARKTLARQAERQWRLCEQRQIRIVTCSDAGYPAILRELIDPPVVFYQRGELREPTLRIAVVGSRAPTSYGRRVATGLASGLAARGLEVVSGAARGIDTCAHGGALEEDGRTVAVLGSGLLRPYPQENERLLERIAENGAVLSEFPPEAPPHKSHFPQRNRLISGLSVAVVVVEAAVRSGSLLTAGHALDQGREVLAVPGPVSSLRSAGCNRLIQQGAKLVQNIEDIVDELPALFRGAVADPPRNQAGPDLAGLSEDEAAVLGILDPVEPIHVDALADRARFGVARLQAALFGLQLRGAVEESPGRYYVCRPQGED